MLGIYYKIFEANTITIFLQEFSQVILSNIKHFRIISEFLKILYNYVDKIHYQLDPNFRNNLTRLVSLFLNFYTCRY
jgi:hypothetical protein